MTGLEPYSGRPTASNETLDAFLSDGVKLDLIAEAVSDMNRSIRIADAAAIRAQHCLEAVRISLDSYFSEYGGWNAESAEKAVEGFEKNGFKSALARKFAMFMRKLFFDDGDPVFQAVNCIGITSEKWYGGFISTLGVFEDSVSGNQFAVSAPFTNKEGCYSVRLGRNSADFPSFSLMVPVVDDQCKMIARNYDVRSIRVDVEKLARAGFKYDLNKSEYTTYFRDDDDEYDYYFRYNYSKA